MENSKAIDSKAKHIVSLVMKVGFDTITDSERKELNAWINKNEGNREAMNEMIRRCNPDYTEKLKEQREAHFEKLWNKINKS